MEIQYQTSRDQALKAQRARFMRFKFIRIVNRFGWFLFPLVFFVCLLYQVFPFGDKATINGEPAPLLDAMLSIPFVVGFSILFGVGVQCLLRYVGRSIVRELINKLPDGVFGCKKIILSENTISIQGPMSLVEYNWGLFDGFEDIQDYIILKALGTVVSIVPKKVFASKQEEDAFIKELSKHSTGQSGLGS